MSISLETPIGELAAERLARIRVFDEFGIDYCCGGRQTLAEAARAAGCDPLAVIVAVDESDRAALANRAEDTIDWRDESLTSLTEHIVETHHEFMKRSLPIIGERLAKVLAAHGTNHAELHEVGQIFQALRTEIEGHLTKEEEVLFPLIRDMEARQVAGNAHCGSVNNPIRVMEHEHDNAGEALRRLRALTGGYVVPEDGCTTYRALLAELAVMEDDLHEHIHKENNILHPRAAALEASLLAAKQGES